MSVYVPEPIEHTPTTCPNLPCEHSTPERVSPRGGYGGPWHAREDVNDPNVAWQPTDDLLGEVERYLSETETDNPTAAWSRLSAAAADAREKDEGR